MTSILTPTPERCTDAVFVRDEFSDPRRPGKVIGSECAGLRRRGVDAEGIMSIDARGVRIGMMARPGWGRAGICYGPFERRAGLAMTALVLNGHNASQGYRLERPLRQLAHWGAGATGLDPLWRRVARWPRRAKRESVFRRLRCWHEAMRRGSTQKENLAVGWFASEGDPELLGQGQMFVMRSACHRNGELLAGIDEGHAALMRDVQDVPICYVVVLRERGAAYYACAMQGAHGLGCSPRFRPIAIDMAGTMRQMYAGVHQGVAGEIGFSVDTRIFAMDVRLMRDLDAWYGTAQAADRLSGEGRLDGSAAEQGGAWRVVSGDLVRTSRGAVATGEPGAAVLMGSTPAGLAPAGLVHALVTVPATGMGGGLLWRSDGMGSGWRARLSRSEVLIEVCTGGDWMIVARHGCELKPDVPASLQILDDGSEMNVIVNGRALCEEPIQDDRFAEACSSGIVAMDTSPVSCFEAHPREVSFDGLDIVPRVGLERGGTIALEDTFEAPANGQSEDLEGRPLPDGSARWSRTVGRGHLVVGPEAGARCAASLNSPNPSRTAYTVPWLPGEPAEVEVEMVPPGMRRGEGHRGRGGVIFWQDARNYIIINLWLDDQFDGASISSFFYLNGHEDIYDAVWTNVGSRITWGVPFRLGVGFDGMEYLARVNDEPVLYRALSDVYPDQVPLVIRRIGLCVNWEFGNDTGTLFRRFSAQRRRQ